MKKKLIILSLSGVYSKNWAVKTNYYLYDLTYIYHGKNSPFLLFFDFDLYIDNSDIFPSESDKTDRSAISLRVAAKTRSKN